MERFGFQMYLTDESVIPEYERLHQPVADDVLEAHREAGIRNYTIFRDGLRLIAYFEAEDPKAALDRLADSPVMPGWWEKTGALMETDAQGRPKMDPLPEVFHME